MKHEVFKGLCLQQQQSLSSLEGLFPDLTKVECGLVGVLDQWLNKLELHEVLEEEKTPWEKMVANMLSISVLMKKQTKRPKMVTLGSTSSHE